MRKWATILLLIVSILGFAQSNGKLRGQAIDAVNRKDWYAAQQYALRFYSRDSTNLRMRYIIAQSSLMTWDLQVAITFGRPLAEQHARRFPLAAYFVAEAYMRSGDYKRAGQWFRRFVRYRLSKERFRAYAIRARRQAEACDENLLLLQQPLREADAIAIEQVNKTASAEFAPFEEHGTLYYTSTATESTSAGARVFRWDAHSKPMALDTSFNSSQGGTGNVSVSYDGRTLICSRCAALNASEMSCRLMSSFQAGKGWSAPEPMDRPLNVEGYSTTQPCISKLGNNDVVFFSSNRAGGFGGMDIWYSVRVGADYAEPVNAGENVNSPDDDVTPFFDTVSGELYFASTWLHGRGGFDIFKSAWNGSVFLPAVNAGTPLNSSYNDLYFARAGRNTYFSSNRPGKNGAANGCCADIYRVTADSVPPPPATDSVELLKNTMKLLVPLTLYFHNDEPDPRTRDTVTAFTYEETFNRYLPLRETYVRKFSEGTGDRESSRLAIETFFSDSVEEGMSRLVLFKSLLKKCLLRGESVTITMKGYCSPLASTDYNIDLAKRRVSSLRNWFLSVDDGFFRRFLNAANGARLTFDEDDVGELPVSAASDDAKNTRSSVYSPNAARERKIQVIAVSFGNQR